MTKKPSKLEGIIVTRISGIFVTQNLQCVFKCCNCPGPDLTGSLTGWLVDFASKKFSTFLNSTFLSLSPIWSDNAFAKTTIIQKPNALGISLSLAEAGKLCGRRFRQNCRDLKMHPVINSPKSFSGRTADLFYTALVTWQVLPIVYLHLQVWVSFSWLNICPKWNSCRILGNKFQPEFCDGIIKQI